MNYGPVTTDDVRSLRALQAFSEDQLALLASVMVRRTYEAGQLIFLEGDPTVGLWFVLAGQVKIIKYSTSGRVQALCMLNRGKCFGNCPLFNDGAYPATAEAVDEVTLFILPIDTMRWLLEREPRFASVLLRLYSQRLAQLAGLSERLGAWTTADRINDCLVANAVAEGDEQTVALTHDRLAMLSGTVREVVTRHLSTPEKAGIVRVEPRQITLLDVASLKRPCTPPAGRR